MKKYGTDELKEVVLSYDGKMFVREKEEGEDCFVGSWMTEIIGCAFLSGWVGPMLVVKSKHGFTQSFIVTWNQKESPWSIESLGNAEEGERRFKYMGKSMPICLFGTDVLQPELVFDFCNKFGNERIFVCSIVNELVALGALVVSENLVPNRIIQMDMNNEKLDIDSIEFDKTLEDDGLGKMADLVSNGFPVENKIKNRIGENIFYGNVLHKDCLSADKVIVRMAEVDKFFPFAPISAKNYASTCSWVRLEVGIEFKRETRYEKDYIDVFVATDYFEDVAKFMRFYKTFSKNGYVFVSEKVPAEYNGLIPIFRADRVYKIEKEQYEKDVRVL